MKIVSQSHPHDSETMKCYGNNNVKSAVDAIYKTKYSVFLPRHCTSKLNVLSFQKLQRRIYWFYHKYSAIWSWELASRESTWNLQQKTQKCSSHRLKLCMTWDMNSASHFNISAATIKNTFRIDADCVVQCFNYPLGGVLITGTEAWEAMLVLLNCFFIFLWSQLNKTGFLMI